MFYFKIVVMFFNLMVFCLTKKLEVVVWFFFFFFAQLFRAQHVSFLSETLFQANHAKSI